eukprot:11168316-Lingulodinium_polyedra.AAC.1
MSAPLRSVAVDRHFQHARKGAARNARLPPAHAGPRGGTWPPRPGAGRRRASVSQGHGDTFAGRGR